MDYEYEKRRAVIEKEEKEEKTKVQKVQKITTNTGSNQKSFIDYYLEKREEKEKKEKKSLKKGNKKTRRKKKKFINEIALKELYQSKRAITKQRIKFESQNNKNDICEKYEHKDENQDKNFK